MEMEEMDWSRKFPRNRSRRQPEVASTKRLWQLYTHRMWCSKCRLKIMSPPSYRQPVVMSPPQLSSSRSALSLTFWNIRGVSISSEAQPIAVRKEEGMGVPTACLGVQPRKWTWYAQEHSPYKILKLCWVYRAVLVNPVEVSFWCWAGRRN